MGNVLVIALYVLWTVAIFGGPWIRGLRCTCGRSAPPYFYRAHERHALMVVEAVALSCISAFGVLILGVNGFDLFPAVMTPPNIVLAVVAWRCVRIHGSGRRRWPRRLAGLVRVNQHGRLVVHPT